MARIPQEAIDRVRELSDILEVVSDYVELRRRGRNFFGLCPFHTEKTPSFSVAPDKQIFHCFGCGIGGNVITFLMEYERIEFVDAVQKLGQRYGIEVRFEKDDTTREFITLLYEIHELAVGYFQRNLHSASGEKVLKYLKGRGLSSMTLNAFAVGFADSSWDGLYTVAKSKRFPDDVMEKCGLFTVSEKGTFDRFRTRIMFPIANLAGRVVAFGGRDFEVANDVSPLPAKREGRRAKYVNSPETPIYHKSNILFGLSKTKEAVRKGKSIIIVEGYTDFLQLYQNGIHNIAATSGTALTEQHVNNIRKFTNTVYLAFDGDRAGKQAAIRAGYNLLKGGLSPEIIAVPEGSDPDSWVKEKGAGPLLAATKTAKGLIDFHLENSGFDLSRPADRSRLAGEMMTEVTHVRDEIVRRFTIKQVAEALSVEEEVLLRMLATRSVKMRVQGEAEPVLEERAFYSSTEKAQLEIVRLLATAEQDAVGFVKKNVNLDHFSHPLLKSLAKSLLDMREKGSVTDLSAVVEQFPERSDRDLASRVLFEASPHPDAHQVAVDCLVTLEQFPLKQRISKQRIKLRRLEKNGEDTSSTVLKVLELQEQLKALDSKRAELLNLSGRT